MRSRLNRRISVLLIGVLTLTGSAAAFSACRHGDAAPQAVVGGHDAHAAGHGAHALDTGAPDSTPDVGAGCDCGCDCSGNCNHVCSSTSLPPMVVTTIRVADAALHTGRGDIPANPATHPPLRPPTSAL